MGNRECSLEVFRKDVASHEMTIAMDSGVYRHLRFAKPGTGCYHFDIVTWPGHLAISGDMGSSVFTRLHDMFEFFRAGPETTERRGGLYINAGYWAEKCIANDGEKTEFRKELFADAVKRRFDNHFEGMELSASQKASKSELWSSLEDTVLSCADDGHHEAVRAAMDFEGDAGSFARFNLHDFYEESVTDYTFHFIWRLYAIAHAVQTYDVAKAAQPEPAHG